MVKPLHPHPDAPSVDANELKELGVRLRRETELRRAAENKVRKLEAFLQSQPQRAREGILSFNTDGHLIRANREAALLLGYQEIEEIIGLAPDRLYADLRERSHLQEKLLRQGSFENEQLTLRKKGGGFLYALMTGTAQKDASGHLSGLDAVFLDITPLKQTELALHASEARLRAMLDSFDGLIYCCSPDYRIEYMNRPFIQRTGRDAKGELCFQALHGLDHVCPWCVNDRVFQGETVRWEIQTPKDNRWYDIINTPIRNPDGSLSKQTLIMDITEKKRLEMEGHRAQRQESVGKLAGGFAHIFNNILQVIAGYNDLLDSRLESTSPTKLWTLEIQQAVHRASLLVCKFLTYSQEQDTEEEDLDPGRFLADRIDHLRSHLNPNHHLTLSLGKDAGFLRVAPTDLEQIVIQLLQNSIDAMPEGGDLTLETARIDLESPQLVHSGNLAPGSYLRISLADSGCGISPDIMDRIFEPFFSTRPLGERLGLGLALVHSRVQKIGGAIDAITQEGRGTTIYLYFPRIDPEVGSKEEEVTPPPPQPVMAV